MNNSFIIAGREYADNARTKGFWINLLMFPIILIASIKIPQLLEEKAMPTRNYILVDQTHELGDVVKLAVDRQYAAKVAESMSSYFMANAKGSVTKEMDLESMPASSLDSMMSDLLESDPSALDALNEPGAIESAIAMMQLGLQEGSPEFEKPRRPFTEVEIPSSIIGDDELSILNSDEIVSRLRPYLLGDGYLTADENELFALIIIPPDATQQVKRGGVEGLAQQLNEKDGVQFWAKNLADISLSRAIAGALNEHLRTNEYKRLGVDEDIVSQVKSSQMLFTSFDPSKDAGEEKVSMADTIRQFAPLGFVYLMWIAIFTVVNMLLNNTIEEKSNRIIEVLLSSATPWEIMCGKLLGIAGIGMTMMLGWILSMVAVLMYMAGPQVEWAMTLLEVIKSSGLLPLFGLYFLCGYLTYAGVFLAIGSLCSTIKESQNFMGTATVILMVPLMTMVFVARDPNGMLAQVLTWIPLYTPFVMMNRAAADPPAFDMYGSAILMLVTIITMLWVSSRIFRIGILRTGQPPKIVELFKSLTTSLKNQ
jgi:ABC-2 type transport system permease protein